MGETTTLGTITNVNESIANCSRKDGPRNDDPPMKHRLTRNAKLDLEHTQISEHAMTDREMIAGLRDEAVRYEAAAKQQDRMAEWTQRKGPAALSRQRAALFRAAADRIEAASAAKVGAA